jgi:hypothetical protein
MLVGVVKMGKWAKWLWSVGTALGTQLNRGRKDMPGQNEMSGDGQFDSGACDRRRECGRLEADEGKGRRWWIFLQKAEVIVRRIAL